MSSWGSEPQARDGGTTMISAGLAVRSSFQIGIKDLVDSAFGIGNGIIIKTEIGLGKRMISSSSIIRTCQGTETCLPQPAISTSTTSIEITCRRLLVRHLKDA